MTEEPAKQEHLRKQRAAIYCRLSEEDRNKQDEEDSRSIQNQKTMLIQYAVQQGWEIGGIYSDDDYTGADRNRPEFNRLLEDARQHRFDIILCKTQSRFTRELELVERYIHGLFPLWQIRFVSVVDNADTANRGNKKARQINGLVNEWYLEDMSENIKSVLNSRRQNGCHIGSFALYGYEKDPEQRGRLRVDPEAAAVVREVFTLFANGYGKTAIARILNERGIPNPTEYKRIKGLRYRQPQGKGGTLWKYPSIAHMLTNEIYRGNMVQGRCGSISYKTKQNRPRPREQWYIVEGTHEPIIDGELWERVQKILARRAKPFKGGTVGLFAGMTRCAGCGYVLRSSKSHGKDYLQCSSRYVCRGACEGAFISVDRLEAAVREELIRLTAELADIERIEAAVKKAADKAADRTADRTAKKAAENVAKKKTSEMMTENIPETTERKHWLQRNDGNAGPAEEIGGIECEMARVQAKEQKYAKMLHRLYPDWLRGLITEEEYLSYRQEFETKRQELRQQAAACERRMNELRESGPCGECGNGSELEPLHLSRCDCFLHPRRLDRELVETMIDYLVIGKKDAQTGEIPIEIHWNF